MKAGEMIAQMRKYRGLTASAFAEKLGVTKQRVGKIEAADDVAFSTIQRAASVLDFEIMAFPTETRPEKMTADITF